MVNACRLIRANRIMPHGAQRVLSWLSLAGISPLCPVQPAAVSLFADPRGSLWRGAGWFRAPFFQPRRENQGHTGAKGGDALGKRLEHKLPRRV